MGVSNSRPADCESQKAQLERPTQRMNELDVLQKRAWTAAVVNSLFPALQVICTIVFVSLLLRLSYLHINTLFHSVLCSSIT